MNAGPASTAPHGAAPARTRLLAAGDAAAAARLAHEAFGGDPFYERVMGFDARAFVVFWDEFFRLALRDARCRVFGIEASDELLAVLVVTLHGFPAAAHAAGYLRRLLARLGPRRVLRYLRFVRGYERAMRRPPAEEEREARCYWLFVSPTAPMRGLGARLLRAAGVVLHRSGIPVATGFIDAGNERLLRFYRRLGISIGPAFPFLGATAARIEMPTVRFVEPRP